MFAVVATGGKQYKVAQDDIIEVEKLAGEAGDVIELKDVLAINDGKDLKIGSPLVSGASIKAEIVKQKKGDKVMIFKKKRRQNYRRTKGHRQEITVLKIVDFGAKAKKAAPKKTAEAKEA